MEKRLHYFYQLKKKSIRLLYITSIVHFFFRIFFYMFYVVEKVGRVDAYTGISNLTFWEKLIQSVIYDLTAISLIIFWYFSTKYIDFSLYVRAWMIGYNVLNRFDRMSIFISRSWFYEESSSDSDLKGSAFSNDLLENLDESETRNSDKT